MSEPIRQGAPPPGAPPESALVVRCSSCHRTERWEGSIHHVVVPGGLRRAPVPERAAMEAVLGAPARGEVVVGACPACRQPMTASGGTPIAWAVAAPTGLTVTFGADGAIAGPDGRLTPDEARRLLDRALPRDEDAGGPTGWRLRAFQIALVLFMLAPFAVWVFSVAFVSNFLAHTDAVLGP